MARAHFVKSARKDYPDHGIKKGESYYWWKFMQGGRGGPKRFSKTQPRRSQLTQSDFYSQLYDAEDALGRLAADDYSTVSDLQSDIEEIKSNLENLKDETDDKFNNMPDGLQQGDSGQLLENRVSELDALISELDGIDFSEPEDLSASEMKAARKGDKSEDDVNAERVEQRCQEIIEEAHGFNWGIE